MQYPRKKSFAAEQLKKRQKKSPKLIAILVVAVIVAVAAVGYALYMRFGIKEFPPAETVAPPAEEIITSIAVLPFVDNSPEKDQEWFCDGLSDAIINALTNISDLKVISRNSTFVFKGEYRDIRAIGDSLNVESVLEGSVLKSGNRIRVTAQLIKVADNSHILSRKFDYEIKDVFTLQDSISFAVVNALKVELQVREKATIEKRSTEDIEAYNLYLWGNFYAQRVEFKKAYEYYQKAVDKDPYFALAYTGITETLGVSNHIKGKEAAEKALELDNNLPEAHTALALIKLRYDWDWAEGKRLIKRALELNPGSVLAHYRYAGYLHNMGRFDEALEKCKYVLELDPLWFPVYTEIIYLCFGIGRYDEGKEYIDRALTIDPNNTSILNHLRRYYALQGNLTQALAVDEKLRELEGTTELNFQTAEMYALLGKRDKAEQIIQKLIEQKKKLNSVYMASFYSILGETEKAIESLEKAYEEHNSSLIWIKYLPLLHDSLRSDPRFKYFLKKMGLPED